MVKKAIISIDLATLAGDMEFVPGIPRAFVDLFLITLVMPLFVMAGVNCRSNNSMMPLPWLIRWITFIYAGFWAGVSGLLYVYYNKYIHPISLSLKGFAQPVPAFVLKGAPA